MKHRVALSTGVGPGLGASLARRFAREGFGVAFVARGSDFIDKLAREISGNGVNAISIAADVSRPAEIKSAVARVRAELGPIGMLVHNASSSSGNGLLRTTPEEFEQTWRTAALGAFVCAQETAPDMLDAGEGTMLFTGATSSVRGGGWLAFSSAKFALRGLAQSLARELWPQGIHVAHVVIDGIIGEPGAASDSEPLLDPAHIADAYWHLANQQRSAWTLELDVRPHREQFFV
ncbi:MAG TPA: SDR family NAD(P)-dependent oxidoreductase [Chthoniobacterales bacterium]|nr:SDR family NAD(P)-dependent oxidoreductase [Chthoniobacterales bacterium]